MENCDLINLIVIAISTQAYFIFVIFSMNYALIGIAEVHSSIIRFMLGMVAYFISISLVATPLVLQIEYEIAEICIFDNLIWLFLVWAAQCLLAFILGQIVLGPALRQRGYYRG